MVIIDPIFMSKLSKIFPEISIQKIEVLTFFVYGMSTKDIAYYKGVSVQAISKSLRELCDVYAVPTADMLKTVYTVRLDLFNHLHFSIEECP
ncbi:conjugal transfer protein TraJ [Escherichia coli]|uniref:conjugal transfer protein TraJ n=1 Tax=Escherichia coli TaxID=562 RepID=UPI000854257F|nr:conjugal transfer protein TraJ [Escherichia coli]ECM2711864.1 conjugal transfer protein TraJ [Salmonella enterica subsp. enterica serovar Typhimurium]ECO9803947.1 conjugal transfer protein TraJ [Salmonella enterica]EEC9300320.1 conjugal transfer protein TraJ [Escherichia coli]EEQ5720391.1 conjugal transfer protein TraJ [Escherichia coli]EEQ5730050.1 conjugal transfer protein TraJ [Escherichia coli]